MGLTSELRDYRLKLASPLKTAHGEVTHRNGVLFSMSDGFHTGWGEAAPLPGWSRESLGDCRKALGFVAGRLGRLEGVDDPRVAETLKELEARPCVRAAVLGALLDLAAKGDGVTVASLLSNQFAAAPKDKLLRSVSVNGLISDGEPSGVAAAAEDLVAGGISAIKLKVAAADPQTDVARVSAARSAIGDDVDLRLDANGGWDVDTAVSTLREMADFNVAFCEEPTTGIEQIAAVGASGVAPVAVDESAGNLGEIAAALRTNTIKVVIVKPQALGGSDFAMAATALAEDFGATAVVTTMIDSAVGVAHAAHLAVAALPLEVHGLATSTLLVDDVGPRITLKRGRLHLPQTPGLGVSPVV
ncbi:MAG: o-succinylbenzoate synthase [Acidimicrobiaceae bacterium]|nr:o-succinylbenzoate synthase [Acidimicrobiaceae bacterium]